MKPTSLLQKAGPFLRSYSLGMPLYCTWQVTNRCNFRCSFCNIWQGHPNSHEELEVEEFEKGAAILREIGPMFVSLAGGEPFLRKDLPEIVSRVGQYHLPILTTNGWLVTHEIAKRLFRAGLVGISVSIDYIDPELHDRRRGVQGAFERAVEALKILVEEKLYSYQEVNLLCVLLHDNLDQVEDLIKLAEKLGATFKIQPYGYIRTGNPSFIPNEAVVEHLLTQKDRHTAFLSSREYLEKFDVHFSKKGVPGCRAGKTYFNIDAFGRVSKCVESHEFVANILEIEPHEMVKLLHVSNRTNTCTSCWYICRGEIDKLYTPVGVLNIAATITRLIRESIFNKRIAEGDF